MGNTLPRLVFWGLNLWILGYTLVLGLALLLQFVLGELPCPLCMLQRYAMILTTLAALWLVRQAQSGTITAAGYMQGLGLGTLAAVLGAAVAARQVMLHILPGDQGYGAPVLGLHLYSWAFVTFCVVILFSALLAVIAPVALPEAPKTGTAGARVSGVLQLAFLAVVAVNAVMIVFLEGFAWVLPDNPVSYGLFTP